MMERVYLNLFLLCGIFSQGIIGMLINDKISESSDILDRQKRVINRIPGEDRKEIIRNFPYLVNIKYNNRNSCVGSILSHHVVITIPSCVTAEVWRFHVVSKSSRSDYGSTHNITDVRRHYGGHPHRPTDGIALLTVVPPFEFGSSCTFIELHSELLLPGMVGTVAGWGYNCRTNDHGTTHLNGLRSIQVPIMVHQVCVNSYRPYNIEIFDDHVCTYDPQKHCGHTDGGAPLVVDGELVGVHLWTGPARGPNNSLYPDVFALLQHSDYNQWIRTNVRDIEAYFGNHNG